MNQGGLQPTPRVHPCWATTNVSGRTWRTTRLATRSTGRATGADSGRCRWPTLLSAPRVHQPARVRRARARLQRCDCRAAHCCYAAVRRQPAHARAAHRRLAVAESRPDFHWALDSQRRSVRLLEARVIPREHRSPTAAPVHGQPPLVSDAVARKKLAPEATAKSTAGQGDALRSRRNWGRPRMGGHPRQRLLRAEAIHQPGVPGAVRSRCTRSRRRVSPAASSCLGSHPAYSDSEQPSQSRNYPTTRTSGHSLLEPRDREPRLLTARQIVGADGPPLRDTNQSVIIVHPILPDPLLHPSQHAS